MGTLISSVVGAISAVTAMVTRTAYPSLRRATGDPVSTIGLTASVGALGVMLPPSITMIIYGSLTETSIVSLFRAGIVPGILQALLFILVAVVLTRRRGARAESRLTSEPSAVLVGAGAATTTGAGAGSMRGAERVDPGGTGAGPRMSVATAWQVPVVILLVAGAASGGLMSPVEAGAGAVLITLGLLAGNRELSLSVIVDTTVNTVTLTAMVMFLLAGAKLIGIVLAFEGFTLSAVEAIEGLDVAPSVVLLVVAAVYVLLGTIFDGLSLMVLTLPMLFPVVVSLGYDPIWFGVFIVAMVQLAEVSPPVGANLFVAQQITGESMGKLWLGVLPYCVALTAFAAVLVAFPGLAGVLS